jgi:hypothetical protein
MNSKSEINKVFVFLTPFHLLSAKSIYGEDLMRANTHLFLIHERIQLDSTPKHLLRFNDSFSFKKSDLYKVLFLRKKINSVNHFIDIIIAQFDFSKTIQFVSGSDREVICQLFILKLRKYFSPKVVMIDEGVGFYTSSKSSDKFLRLVYPVYSLVLLGAKIQHINPLGSNVYTNEIYVRSLELLCLRQNHIKYNTFVLKKAIVDVNTSAKRNILIFTAPGDSNVINETVKTRVLEQIIRSVKNLDLNVFVKPHPREKISYLKNLKFSDITIIEPAICGDELNFKQFSCIINFQSSVIIEVLSSGFSANKVLTIKYLKSNLLDSVFRTTTIVSIENFQEECIREILIQQ